MANVTAKQSQVYPPHNEEFNPKNERLTLKFGKNLFELAYQDMAYLISSEGIIVLTMKDGMRLPIIMDINNLLQKYKSFENFIRISENMLINTSIIETMYRKGEQIFIKTSEKNHVDIHVDPKYLSAIKDWILSVFDVKCLSNATA